jgi:6-phosphogluconolactonase
MSNSTANDQHPPDGVRVLPSTRDVQHAATRIAADILRASHERDVHLVLSGGSTPKGFHAFLAQEPDINWLRVHIWFGDERTVPPTHADSNYRMARETLLDHVTIPPDNIHRMQGELPPNDAARAYDAELRTAFGLTDPASAPPQFDLLILGMGDDGHTASLFPGTAALNEHTRWVVANEVPQQDTWRITLTWPVLNAAKHVLFLVTGANKQAALQAVFGDDVDARPPAAGIQPAGDLTWLLDADAGAAFDAR